MNIYLFQYILGIGVLALHIIIAFLLGYLVYKKVRNKQVVCIENFLSKQGMLLVGLTALAGIIGSLIFSDIYHIEPCKLCWLQRIMLYPQALIMLIALKKNDIQAWTYTLWLSIMSELNAFNQRIKCQTKINNLNDTSNNDLVSFPKCSSFLGPVLPSAVVLISVDWCELWSGVECGVV